MSGGLALVLGLVLLILGWALGLGILWILGLVLVIVGIVLLLMGRARV